MGWSSLITAPGCAAISHGLRLCVGIPISPSLALQGQRSLHRGPNPRQKGSQGTPFMRLMCKDPKGKDSRPLGFLLLPVWGWSLGCSLGRKPVGEGPAPCDFTDRRKPGKGARRRETDAQTSRTGRQTAGPPPRTTSWGMVLTKATPTRAMTIQHTLSLPCNVDDVALNPRTREMATCLETACPCCVLETVHCPVGPRLIGGGGTL